MYHCLISEDPQNREEVKRRKNVRLSARRLSLNKKWRERRRHFVKKANQWVAKEKRSSENVCSTIKTLPPEDACHEMLPTTSTAIWLQTVEKSEIKIEEDIEEEEEEIATMEALNTVDEYSTINSIEVPHENIEAAEDSKCNWVVERAAPQQLQQLISEGINLVDFGYVFKQITQLVKHSESGCGIEHFKIVACERDGLRYVYTVRCEICHYSENIQCLQKNDDMAIWKWHASNTQSLPHQ